VRVKILGGRRGLPYENVHNARCLGSGYISRILVTLYEVLDETPLVLTVVNGGECL